MNTLKIFDRFLTRPSTYLFPSLKAPSSSPSPPLRRKGYQSLPASPTKALPPSLPPTSSSLSPDTLSGARPGGRHPRRASSSPNDSKRPSFDTPGVSSPNDPSTPPASPERPTYLALLHPLPLLLHLWSIILTTLAFLGLVGRKAGSGGRGSSRRRRPSSHSPSHSPSLRSRSLNSSKRRTGSTSVAKLPPATAFGEGEPENVDLVLLGSGGAAGGGVGGEGLGSGGEGSASGGETSEGGFVSDVEDGGSSDGGGGGGRMASRRSSLEGNISEGGDLSPSPPSSREAASQGDPRTSAADPRTQVIESPSSSAASSQLPNPAFAFHPPPPPAAPVPQRKTPSLLLANPLSTSTLLAPSHSPYGQLSSSPPTPPASSSSSSPQPFTLALSSSRPPPSRQPSPDPTTGNSKRPTPFHKPKTLILDLDETLIHSTSRPRDHMSGGGGKGVGPGRGNESHMVEVFLGGRSTVYHVYKRPFVDYFLKKVSGWYTLVIFTASMQEYADPVIDWLDGGRGMFAKRLFRESCVQHQNGAYIKDLSVMNEELDGLCLIDNSPISYSFHQSNGIPIDGWFSDPNDQALLDLLPVLDSLRFTGDVRHVLGLRGF